MTTTFTGMGLGLAETDIGKTDSRKTAENAIARVVMAPCYPKDDKDEPRNLAGSSNALGNIVMQDRTQGRKTMFKKVNALLGAAIAVILMLPAFAQQPAPLKVIGFMTDFDVKDVYKRQKLRSSRAAPMCR